MKREYNFRVVDMTNGIDFSVSVVENMCGNYYTLRENFSRQEYEFKNFRLLEIAICDLLEIHGYTNIKGSLARGYYPVHLITVNDYKARYDVGFKVETCYNNNYHLVNYYVKKEGGKNDNC